MAMAYSLEKQICSAIAGLIFVLVAVDARGDVCWMTTFGAVQTFDQAALQAPSGGKFLVARSRLGDGLDKCDFQVRAVTDIDGDLMWVAISVGAYESLHVKNKRNFAFDRKNGFVEKRGPGIKDHVISTPFTWTSGDNQDATTIVVEGSMDGPTGWRLINGRCNYRMFFMPEGTREPIFRLKLGSNYRNVMEGLCSDFDGDASNDF